ncbi:MAG: Fpg/Nei family DNA glycosylase, partial [Actinomycetota bacterium]|nr:Fpg/Nei family DNA glycosylase [Actinomycetota bacterium]
MPEGHSVHRITRQFERNFVGHVVRASSPQGRFAQGAADLDGRRMTDARAIGKQMFLGFEGDRWLRVHLGIYGAWDFSGDILMDATIAAANGRMGQTNQRGTFLEGPNPDAIVFDSAGENSLTSIGAPRRTRLRMSEAETLRPFDKLREPRAQGPNAVTFPPEPVGQVRVRLLTDTVCADLRGPTACEVLDPAQVEAVVARLGPDPLIDAGQAAEDRFVASVTKRSTPIALLLMDQAVVAGIGNVYRAELLFRARQNPHTPGRLVPEEHVRHLWRDWSRLLHIGVETGQMM